MPNIMHLDFFIYLSGIKLPIDTKARVKRNFNQLPYQTVSSIVQTNALSPNSGFSLSRSLSLFITGPRR